MFTDGLQEKILDGIDRLAEHAYRQLRANAFVKVSLEKDDAGKKLTDTHKNALVDIATDKAMYRVRIAEAEHEAAWELVKSLKTQISALQSLLNAVRAEAEAVTYRQTSGA